MFKLYRRGQVRGIDFSLSMIIFLLTMAQVMVLTNTFITNSRDFQGTTVLQQNTINFGTEILSSTGGNSATQDWATIPTSSLGTDWKFGLATNVSEVDPYKVARLADNNDANYALTYQQLRSGLNFSQDFRIQIVNTINVSITQIIDTGSALNVSGEVRSKGSLIETAEVWLFVYDLSTGIVQAYFDNVAGTFNTVITPNDYGTDAFVVTAIARSGSGNQDLDYEIFTKAAGTAPSINNQTLLPPSDTSTGNKIQIKSTRQQDVDPSLVTHSSFFLSDQATNTSQLTNPTNAPDGTWTLDLTIPPNNIAGVLSHEVVGSTHWIAYSVFPTLLDNDISKVVEPTNIPNNQSTVAQFTFVVRGVLMEMIFTTWE